MFRAPRAEAITVWRLNRKAETTFTFLLAHKDTHLVLTISVTRNSSFILFGPRIGNSLLSNTVEPTNLDHCNNEFPANSN